MSVPSGEGLGWPEGGPAPATEGLGWPEGPGRPAPAAVEPPPPEAAPAPPAPRRAGGRHHRRSRRGSFLWELPFLIVIALVLAFLVKTFVVQAFFIPSGSMENTLEVGDRVLVNKLSYDLHSPHRGDIIVFQGPATWQEEVPTTPLSSDPVVRFFQDIAGWFGFGPPAKHDFIKRVIGVPGDVVACDRNDQVTVNGVVLHERSYLYPGAVPCGVGDISETGPRWRIKVPPGHLWVMGDNREDSADSRAHDAEVPFHGTIPISSVIGKAFLIVWPFSRFGTLGTPSTFQQKALAVAVGGAPYAVGVLGAFPLTLARRRWRRRRGWWRR
jgi:signal peptidase I